CSRRWSSRRCSARRRSRWRRCSTAAFRSRTTLTRRSSSLRGCRACWRRRGLSTTVLLLGGVTMTSFFSALILFTQYLADYADTFRTVRWLMGALDVGSYAPLLAALPLLIVAFGIFAVLPRSLDLISLGQDAAAARGVNVPRAEWLALVSA